MELKDFFRENNRLALAFSGGVDSAYLLYAAAEAGAEASAYYVRSEFQPAWELADAKKLIAELAARGLPAAKLKVIDVSVLDDKNVAANGEERCYYCKKRLFAAITAAAAADGYDLIIDGTNASDKEDERPGMRALKELEVRSPLRECGLTKAEVRLLSREAGLFTWNKPAYACLATRVAAGEEITAGKLAATAGAEDFLFGLGLRDFRVRLTGRTARIQVREEQMALVMDKRGEIVAGLKKYYDSVTLDLEARDE